MFEKTNNLERLYLSSLFSSSPVSCTRCYVCAWTAALCQDFNCYNNPDICTNVNFSPSIVRSVECPAGCETFVMTGNVCLASPTLCLEWSLCLLSSHTDPNGLVQQWRRNCDSSGESVGQWKDPTPRCTTRYQVGLRITRCTCNENLCNHTCKYNLHWLIILFIIIYHILVSSEYISN